MTVPNDITPQKTINLFTLTFNYGIIMEIVLPRGDIIVKKFLLMISVIAMVVMTGCSSISIVNKDKVEEGDYLLPSDTQVITEVDLSKLNETELKYAYEEIFARHGKIYSDANLEKYFNSKSWYSPNPSFEESDLTALESENAGFISAYIVSNTSVSVPASNNTKYDANYYYKYFMGDNTYIIPDSSTRRLTAGELYGYSSNTLALIRNEIYARNGYVFSKKEYKDYFSSKMWYSPNPNFNESFLNSIEKYNIQLIKSME